MTNEKSNQVIDLWNAGKSISEISEKTGLSACELGKWLLEAVERGIRVRRNVTGLH